MCDKDGLLGLARKDKLTPQQLEFMRDDLPDGLSLLDVAKHAKPTVLLGLSAQRGLFKEELVKEVAKHAARPFIFPLSNPTSSAECTAAEAYLWTEGRALFASGSPFEPVTINGKTYKPSQANNFFVFPVRMCEFSFGPFRVCLLSYSVCSRLQFAVYMTAETRRTQHRIQS